MAANHIRFPPSSPEEGASSSSAEESCSQEEHLAVNQKSDSESDSESEGYESDGKDSVESGDGKPKSIGRVEDRPSEDDSETEGYESDGKDSVESGDGKPKSIGQVEGRPSEESNSKEEEETDDDVSENENARKESEYPKSDRLEVAPPSESFLKVKKDAEIPKSEHFQRVWTLEDEVTLLKSIINFRLKEGKEVDPSSLEFFCDFLKGKLSFTERPERRQLYSKIRALKKKYSDSSVATFTGEHDLKMKELADQVWIINTSNSSKRKCPLLKEEIRKMNLYGLEKKVKYGEEAHALEEKLRIQKISTMKQDLKRMILKKELFRLMLEGFQKSCDWIEKNGAGKGESSEGS